MIPFVDLNAQYQTIRAEVDSAVQNVINSSGYINGYELEVFESTFAKKCGVKHVNCVGSGTEALHMALRSLKIGPGDEVITVTNTWISTAFAASYVGATPVLVDVDPDTYQMDLTALKGAITPRTKAVIAVHLYGHPAPMTEIIEICHQKGIYVIEDAAQAVFAEIDGMRAGTIGDIGCFSFYPSKNLGCFGDGGAVVTNNDEINQKLQMLINYGQSQPFVHDLIGYNTRLDTIQAAILNVKLPHLEDWNNARRKHAETYRTCLSSLPIKLPVEAANTRAVYHLFVIEIDRRNQCINHLKEDGVMAQIHYPTPIHLQPCYSNLGYKKGDFPVAESAANRILSLPIYPELSESQIQKIVSSLKKFVG